MNPHPDGRPRRHDAGKPAINDVLAALRPRLHLCGHHHRFSETTTRRCALGVHRPHQSLISAHRCQRRLTTAASTNEWYSREANSTAASLEEREWRFSRREETDFGSDVGTRALSVIAVENDFVERVYEKLASIYDLIFGPTLHPGRLVARDRMGITPGDRILEVGVGTGINASLYPPRLPRHRHRPVDVDAGQGARAGRARGAAQRSTAGDGCGEDSRSPTTRSTSSTRRIWSASSPIR